MRLQLLSDATATNNPPTTSSQGFALQRGRNAGKPNEGLPETDSAMIQVGSTDGSGAMEVTLKLWGWSELLEKWLPFGTGSTNDTRGTINEGNSIGLITGIADTLIHSEVVAGLRGFSRVYLEVVDIDGTDTAVSAWLVG